jgi:hypothetical protein
MTLRPNKALGASAWTPAYRNSWHAFVWISVSTEFLFITQKAAMPSLSPRINSAKHELTQYSLHQMLFIQFYRTRDTSATGEGMDGRGSTLRRGNILLSYIPFKPVLGPIKPPIQCVPGEIFPGVKRSGREAEHSSSNAEVKNDYAKPPLHHTPS